LLEELRKSKSWRFLGEILGPVTVIVKPGAQAKVLARWRSWVCWQNTIN